MGKKPSFVKILSGNFLENLRIPPAFTQYIPLEAPPEVILKGSSGCKWKVELSRKRSHPPAYYLNSGWDEFVKDHSLQEHDLLLFKYDCGMHFTVLIFDKTACEREDTSAVKQKVVDAREKKSNICEEKANAGKARKRTRAQFETGNSVPVAENVERKKRELDDQHASTQKSNSSKGDPGSFTSKFPFFVKFLPQICFNGAHSLMHIPATFHGHIKRKEMYLQDPRGKKWPVSVQQLSPRRLAFAARGWRPFCKAAAVKVGDTCIFELRDSSTFRVKIYPCK